MTSAQKYRNRKKAAERNHMEGKIGQAKRGYGLNNIKARLASTSDSWVQALIFIMNLTKVSLNFCGFFEWAKILREKIFCQE